jgi:hypothetical protein
VLAVGVDVSDAVVRTMLEVGADPSFGASLRLHAN